MMLSAGQALTPLEISSVDADKMKVMALILDDPNPIHYDANAVQRLGLGDRPINQGPNGVAYVINMLMASSPRAKAVARIRLRFMANTYAGDRLVAGGTVTALDANAAECEVWLRRGDDTIVAGTATLLLNDNH